MQIPFFGIGAMRAGTSWLSHVLNCHPDCALHPAKEMHFFDVRYDVAGHRYLRKRAKQFETAVTQAGRRLNAELDKLPRAAARRRSRRNGEVRPNRTSDRSMLLGHGKHADVLSTSVRSRYRRIAALAECIFLSDPDSYAATLRRIGEGRAAFGEFTPAYALLPADGFREIMQIFPDARFIFIMRDPVDRLWSQIRYTAAKSSRDGGTAGDLGELFRKALADPQGAGRSDYCTTVKRLESAVPEERIHYFFFESTTNPDAGPAEIRRLERALGLCEIELPPDLFRVPKNASSHSAIPLDCVTHGLSAFAPVYRFIADRFGTPPGWRAPP